MFDFAAAMLATQLNDLVTNGELETFTVIRLDKFICNTIQPGRLVSSEVQLIWSTFYSLT